MKALEQIWEIYGRICSKRLHPYLPEGIKVLERCGEIELSPETKELLLHISRSSIDRPAPRALFAFTVRRLLVVCLLAVGLWQLEEGSWVYAKAGLAQHLLQRAWSRTLAGEANVKPWPWADTWPVARLVVAGLGVDQIVLEGAYGRTLAFGPGHVESSARPGENGTMILTGHRDTDFSFLQRIRAHDEIALHTYDGHSGALPGEGDAHRGLTRGRDRDGRSPL